MQKPTYHVMNENTLGFILPTQPGYLSVLHGSVLKGGHDWKNGPVPISSLDKLRDATLADFDEYRVSPKGHIA